MNVLFCMFLLAASIVSTIRPESTCCEIETNQTAAEIALAVGKACATIDFPLRSKLIALLEQEGKLVQKAFEHLKEHDRACTGPVIGKDGNPVCKSLFKDLQPSPLINSLGFFGPKVEKTIAVVLAPNKEQIPTLALLSEAAELRFVRTQLIPLGEYFLEQYAARKQTLVHAFKMWGDMGTAPYVTSDDVLKSVAKSEFEIFDTNVDKILACLHGDTQIFMACVLSKVRAQLAAGYLASKNQEMTALLYLNMFGFKLFEQEVLFNPACANIWSSVRISGATHVPDSDFFLPFIAAEGDVYKTLFDRYIASINRLSATAADKKLLTLYTDTLRENACCLVSNAWFVLEKLSAITGLLIQWQLEKAILQECLV